MPKGNRLAIVTIVYNTSALLTGQVDCIRKYCKDTNYDIIVVDNSNDRTVIEAIQYYCTELKVTRIKTVSAEANGSDSNVFVCNHAYFLLKDRYDFFLYLDHDTFPLRDFSVLKILEGRAIAGLAQEKTKTYFMQNCLMWDNRTIDHNLIDFGVDHELGLDTGGKLYKIIEKYSKDACVFFNEQYYQNPYFRQGFYNFYATFNDDMFMHFINGSNWNPTEGNEERINSLINILNERTA
jgi:hypothetical protein